MLEIKPGKYKDLSNEEYHSHTDSISRSAIMDFAVSPKKYWANYLNPERVKKESTDAMLFGELFHQLILEPEKFYSENSLQYISIPMPEVGLLKNIGREEYDRQKSALRDAEKLDCELLSAWLLKNKGKYSIRQKEYELLSVMKESIYKNKQAHEFLTEGENEVSYFWNDPETGLLLKARPDVLYDTVCVDLKTCKDASPRAFQRAMCDGGYHIQAAMIIDAVKAVDNREISSFVNIAIEKEYPYAIGIYILDQAAIDSGREKYKRILKEMKIAREKNEWSDYPTQVIGLPGWYE